jgi:hypothetical protein
VELYLLRHGMKFYRDGEGNPRSESGAASALISRFLMEDIQDSLNTCREILGIVEQILNGELRSWKQVGNAHVLSLSADEAIGESLVAPAEKPFRISLEDFRDLIQSWLHFLEQE